MSIGARTFVAINFIILGLSFIATTGVLFYEFSVKSDTDWTALATYYSHLFLFFPTFGLLALIAFYVPASVLVDMYWKHVPGGKVRFVTGYLVAVLLALIGGSIIGGGGGLKSLFEITPQVLKADVGAPAGCADDPNVTCARVPALNALAAVRREAKKRAGMSKFVRDCAPDPLIGDHPERATRRYCFASQSLLDAESCCKAQQDFGAAVAAMYVEEENRAITGKVHHYLLPLKVFFLIVLFMIAMLLVFRHRMLEANYEPYLSKLQRGVLIGAASMVVWPLMNLAFLQSSGLLYGAGYESVYRDVSPFILAAFVLWALLLVFFFFKSYDRADKDMENMGRMAGVVGSIIAAANIETIVDYAVRFAGSGATFVSLGGLFLVVAIAFVAIVLQPRRTPGGSVRIDK
ncbi:MAG: hypothetical protein RIC14_16320 [Filomicrobium sp.]